MNTENYSEGILLTCLIDEFGVYKYFILYTMTFLKNTRKSSIYQSLPGLPVYKLSKIYKLQQSCHLNTTLISAPKENTHTYFMPPTSMSVMADLFKRGRK